MMHGVPQQPLGIRQRVPIIGQQQPTQQQQDQIARIQIMQAVNEMASAMYVQLAVAHITTRDVSIGQEVDEGQLRDTAKMCMAAARAYFFGIGAIQDEQGG